MPLGRRALWPVGGGVGGGGGGDVRILISPSPCFLPQIDVDDYRLYAYELITARELE